MMKDEKLQKKRHIISYFILVLKELFQGQVELHIG
jgi:hypothetical protein